MSEEGKEDCGCKCRNCQSKCGKEEKEEKKDSKENSNSYRKMNLND